MAQNADQPSILLVAALTDEESELPELVADRPDYTEATEVVGRNIVQVENGFTFERNRGGSNLAGPELLMRIGLNRRLELRIGGDGFLSQRIPGQEIHSGYSDIDVGAKILLFDQRGHLPSIALIPIVSVPLGSAAFSSGAYDPTLKVAVGKDLSRGISVGGNVNVSSLMSPDGRFLQTAYSVSLGHNLGKGFDGFWELFDVRPWDKGDAAAWIANAGITRSLGRNAQIDVRIGKRLTDAGPDWFWGFGLAMRQPAWRLLSGLLPGAANRQ